jgi:hypothetical protein
MRWDQRTRGGKVTSFILAEERTCRDCLTSEKWYIDRHLRRDKQRKAMPFPVWRIVSYDILEHFLEARRYQTGGGRATCGS